MYCTSNIDIWQAAVMTLGPRLCPYLQLRHSAMQNHLAAGKGINDYGRIEYQNLPRFSELPAAKRKKILRCKFLAGLFSLCQNLQNYLTIFKGISHGDYSD